MREISYPGSYCSLGYAADQLSLRKQVQPGVEEPAVCLSCGGQGNQGLPDKAPLLSVFPIPQEQSPASGQN